MKNKIIVYTLITVMLVNQLPAYGSQSRTATNENKTVKEITTAEESPSAGDTPVTVQEDGETGSETDTSDDGTSPVYEDRTVSESWTLTEDVIIGNLTVSNYAKINLNGHMLTVMGNCTISAGYLYIQGGELRCMGDMALSAYSYLYMENINDYLYIEGNFAWWGGCSLTAGTMEVKGDFTATSDFKASGTHKMIFSGTGKQRVTLSDGGCFGEVELCNYSPEGVEIEYSFNYGTLKDNGCVLTYAGLDGERGHVLEADETYDGLYYLVTDTLDLNGHTLTINGDLVQGGGTINVNGGTLIINGSYLVESMTQDENSEITYGDSAGVLIMQSSADYVYVGGSYVNHGINADDGNLTDGVLEIAGDIEIADKSGAVFCPQGSHTVAMSGMEPQTVLFTFMSGSAESENASHFANLTLNNPSEAGITFTNPVYVTGCMMQNETVVYGMIMLCESTVFADNTYRGDIQLASYNLTLSQGFTLYGNVKQKEKAGINTDITVYGDWIADNKELNVRKSLRIYGSSQDVRYKIPVGESYVYIQGDMKSSYALSASGSECGTIEVGGDIDLAAGYTMAANACLRLSGNEKQTITHADKLHVGILELTNTSVEGVYADHFFTAESLIRNGVRLSYGDIEGEYGWTLTEDAVYEGDLILFGETLDLNGYSLTVTGDFIQMAGSVSIHGGSLIVSGDYRMQNMTKTDEVISYGRCNAALVMQDENDSVSVQGDFICATDVDNRMNLSAGIMSVYGDFTVEKKTGSGYSFDTTGSHTLRLCGGDTQTVNVENGLSIARLIVENESEAGITINGILTVSAYLDDRNAEIQGYIKILDSTELADTEFSASLYVSSSLTLDSDLYVLGDVVCLSSFYVKAGLTVDGTVHMQSYMYIYDTMEVQGDLSLEESGHVVMREGSLNVYGSFTSKRDWVYMLEMTHEADYVHIYGDFTFNGINSSTLSAGTLVVDGDFSIAGGFSARGTHRTILGGDTLQTVTMPSGFNFNILELQNYSEEGIYSATAFNKNELIRNGCRLKYGDMTGEFGWTLTEDTRWDGDLILIDDTMDLNGYTLTVTGNLVQVSGELHLNGGSLIIGGDYRMQSIQTENTGTENADTETVMYGNSTALLYLNDDSETIEVGGSMYVWTTRSETGLLCAGQIILKGNLDIDTESNREAFEMSGNACLVFAGDGAQGITSHNENNKTMIADVRYENTSGEPITHGSNLYITGTIDMPDTGFADYIKLTETARLADCIYTGNIYLCSGYVFEEAAIVNGDIKAEGDFTIEAPVLVHGSVLAASRYVSAIFNGGQMSIDGDLTFYDSGTSEIIMSHAEDSLYIGGSLSGIFWADLSAGTLEIRGNVGCPNSSINTSGTHQIILSGDTLQLLSIAQTSSIDTLVLENHSDAGVYAQNYFRYNTLIKNGCRFIIGAGDYQTGYTLTEDVVVCGDYMLGYGVLDLNGHTLTVEGDFIHAGAELKLNGGTLVVGGDYRLQNIALTDGEESCVKSQGILDMTGDKDTLSVAGDIILEPYDLSCCKKVTNGTIEAAGNIINRTTGRITLGGSSRVVLSGTKPQTIDPYLTLAGLEIPAGVSVTVNDTIVTGELSELGGTVQGTIQINSLSQLTEEVYHGSLYVTGESVLTHDTTIQGSLNINNMLDLNAYELNTGSFTGGRLTINGGRMNVIGDMKIGSYAALVMQNPDDYICVGGDFTFSSGYDHTEKLTAGTLELRGSFYANDSFIATGTHKTILEIKIKSSGRDYIQTIDFGSRHQNGHFHTLVLKKSPEKYNFVQAMDAVADEIIYEPVTLEKPNPVTKLTVTAADASRVSLEYVPDTTACRVLGYEIHRDGVPIATTTNTWYTDTAPESGVTYTYEVYPFDAYGNMAQSSPQVQATTLPDEAAPSVPDGLTVSALSSASAEISWLASTDNKKVAGYKVYRDGVYLCDVTDATTYRDTGLAADTEYSYTVSACDEAGNESGQSQAVEAVPKIPLITKVTPEDYSSLGNEKASLSVTFRKYDTCSSYTVEIDYYDAATDTWFGVNKKRIIPGQSGSAYCVATVDWDTSMLKGYDYPVRFTVTDRAGGSVSATNTYYVDNRPPEVPGKLAAQDVQGVISLTWDASVSADCIGYRVYRGALGEEPVFLTELSGAYVRTYTDKTAEPDSAYVYAVTAFDGYGNESTRENTVIAACGADTEAPRMSDASPEAGRVNGTVEISAAAKDNRGISAIRYAYRKDGEETWIPLGEETAEDGCASYTWDTTALADGIYYVNMTAIDTAGNESTGNFTRRYEVDNSGPSRIVLTGTNSGSTYIQLMWEDVTEADFDCFAVEQYVNGRYIEVGREKNILGYTVEKLAPGTEYTFRVVGYDNLGNRGEASDVCRVSTTGDAIAPSVSAVYPASGRYRDSIPLSVTVQDNYAVSHVSIAYSYDGENYTSLSDVAASGTQTSASLSYDMELDGMPEGTVYIRYVAYDKAGNRSSLTSENEEVVISYVIDRTAPACPENLRADCGDGYIGLTWDAAKEEDIAGYRLYRADAQTGIYTRLCSALTSVNYYDRDAEPGKAYLYRLEPYDTAGNVGPMTDAVAATASEDTTAPELRGMSPESGSITGKNPIITVLATDNSSLSSIRLWCKAEGEDIWNEVGEKNVSGGAGKAEFMLDLSEYGACTYQVRAGVTDRAGNMGIYFENTYTLDVDAPTSELLLETFDYAIGVNLTEPDAEDFSYFEVYRRCVEDAYGVPQTEEYQCLGRMSGHTYRDENVTPLAIYEYQVRVYDKAGNYSTTESVTCHATDNDTEAPVAVLPEKTQVIAGMEFTLDGGDSCDNARIVSYMWDLGDGSVLTGMRPVYSYSEPGTYTVTLTVTDSSGNQGTVEGVVEVLPDTGTGSVVIQVTDEKGVVIPYAYVYLNEGEDVSVSYRTDNTGCVTIAAQEGTYEAAAYQTGYIPKDITVEVSSYTVHTYTLVIPKGDIVVGKIKVRRMGLQEIVDSGVDLSDPANLHTFTFTVSLTFEENLIPIEYIYFGDDYIEGSVDSGNSGGLGLDNPSPPNNDREPGPKDKNKIKTQIVSKPAAPGVPATPVMFAYMKNTQTISWLKDMYMVELGVLNIADSEYVIEDASATLNLPDGMSLAVTADGQSKTQSMGSVAGQEVKCASWVVKGDEPGKYNISADFTGNLSPFGTEVNAHFETEQIVEVSDFSGLQVVIKPEVTGYSDYDYYIQYEITNNTGKPLYNFTTSIGPSMEPGQISQTYIVDLDTGARTPMSSYTINPKPTGLSNTCGQTTVMRGDQKLSVPVFEDGETIYGTWSAPFKGSKPSDSYFYQLLDGMVDVIEGENLNVSVEFKPEGQHVNIHLVAYVNQSVVFTADPVNVTTGAYTDSCQALALSGDAILSLDMNYDSRLTETMGEMGYGWSHNFESYIRAEEGVLHYYTSPGVCAAFVNEDNLNGIMYGTIEDGEIILSDEVYGDTITYRSINAGMKDYVLVRNADGSYTMTTPGGYVYDYDADGLLYHMTNADGSAVTLSRTKDQTIITEDKTGKRLLLNYAEGRLISVADDYGRSSTFTYNEAGMLTTYTNPLGERTSYTYDAEGRLISGASHDKTVFVTNEYDEKGRVVSQKDVYGNETKFSYTDTDDGMITVVTSENGRQIRVESDKRCNITSVSEADGLSATYTYDEYGRKTGAADGEGNTTGYTYDEQDRITGYTGSTGEHIGLSYDDRGNITAITSEDGTATMEYNSAGNIISAIDGDMRLSYGYDDAGNLISFTKEGKGTQTYGYTGCNLTSITDERGNTATMEYDGRGNVISITNTEGATTRYTYDALNRVTAITYANGAMEYYTYDLYGNVSGYTDPLGNITTYTYDAVGRQTGTVYADGSTESMTYDAAGNMVSFTGTDGITTSYAYDGNGNCTQITYADGTTEQYTHDSAGRITSVTDTLGNVTTYTYDDTGHLLNMALPDGQEINTIYKTGTNSREIQGVMDANGNTVSYSYDANGNITSITDALDHVKQAKYNAWNELTETTDANGNRTAYEYDAAGNCTKITYADGSHVDITYDACSRAVQVANGEAAVSCTYDAVGNMTSCTDELGNTSTYEYDLCGRLVSETDAAGKICGEYTYDAVGRLLQETDTDGIITVYDYNDKGYLSSVTQTSPLGETKTYSYSYDDMGRVTSVTDPAGTVSGQSYDSVGNVTAVTYPAGGGISYEYDSLGRLTGEMLSIGTKKTYTYNADGVLSEYTNGRNQKTTYTYDSLGRITEVSDEAGTIRYTYDGNGNVLTVSETDTAGVTGTITRTYDCMNRVTEVTDYKGDTVKYGYDELGNLISITYAGGEIVRYAYYPDGNLMSMTDGDGLTTAYTYDKRGYLLTTQKPDGSVESCTYDDKGRLSVQTVEVHGEVLEQYSYTYDQWGNISGITHETGGADADGTSTDAGTAGTDADGISPEGETAKTDSVNETTVLTDTEMTYDEANRMVTFNGEDVLYDADGNMTYGPVDGQMCELTYDCRNRLIQAGDIAYTYDAENIRTGVETDRYTEEYTVDRVSGLTQILEIERTYKNENSEGDDADSANGRTEERTYYYGNGLVYEKSSRDAEADVGEDDNSGEQLLVYHYNHLGSTTLITDGEGSPVQRFSYGTYGELLNREDAETTEYGTIRFLYNGQLGVVTDDNGLYYMRARYYNPEIRRFINQDILTGNIGNSASLNRYSYVEGNPVSYTDPFGLSPYKNALNRLYTGINMLKNVASNLMSPENRSMLFHMALNVMGCIPGPIGFFSNVTNSVMYFVEDNPDAAIENLIFSLAGTNLLEATQGFCSMFGISSDMAQLVGGYLSFADNTMAAMLSAGNFGNAAADMIDKYMVNEAEFSVETVLETAMLGSYGLQTSTYANYAISMGNYLQTCLNAYDAEKMAELASQCEMVGSCDSCTEYRDVIQPACFVAGTKVLTSDGEKDIEDIGVGDYVLAEDPETGEQEYKRVTNTYIHEKDVIVHVCVGDEEIETTKEHPFYVEGVGFVMAGSLKEGDVLRLADGRTVEVSGIETEQLSEPVYVYNLEVEDYHTYFVSELGVLVHNECGNNEIVLPRENSHEAARNALLQEVNTTGAFKNGSNKYIGRLEQSYGYGKQVGRQSLDGKVRWRLDYDDNIGVHYNFEDFSNGKGANAIKKVIPIDISYDEYKSIIDLWN